MLRHSPILLTSISLDRNVAEPLHRQLFLQLRNAIHSSELKAGEWLPSTRMLAKLLGVSRNTICLAYDELLQEGLVRGEPGAGTCVNASRGGVGLRTNNNLKRLLRQAHFPARAVSFYDPDGNAFYLNL